MGALSAFDVVAVGLSAALTAVLAAVAIVDIREMRIPNAYNACVLGLGLLACALLHHQTVAWGFISALAGFCVMASIRMLYFQLRDAEGLGLGDVKFVAAAASWVGLESLPHMILFATVTALAWAGFLAIRGRRLTKFSRLPFGPFLAIGFWVTWIAGLPQLIGQGGNV